MFNSIAVAHTPISVPEHFSIICFSNNVKNRLTLLGHKELWDGLISFPLCEGSSRVHTAKGDKQRDMTAIHNPSADKLWDTFESPAKNVQNIYNV